MDAKWVTEHYLLQVVRLWLSLHFERTRYGYSYLQLVATMFK